MKAFKNLINAKIIYINLKICQIKFQICFQQNVLHIIQIVKNQLYHSLNKVSKKFAILIFIKLIIILMKLNKVFKKKCNVYMKNLKFL